jgi:hypothetical protein
LNPLILFEQSMSDWHDESPNGRDGVTIPTIWVAIALSLLIHAAALWEWLPKLRLPSPEETKRGEASGSLVVRLAPPPSLPAAPPHSPALNARPSPGLEARPPMAAARLRPAPPVIALNRPAPNLPSPPAVPSVTAPTPVRPPADGDLASYIEARRRARAESAPAASASSGSSAPLVEDDNARANRIASANLGSQRKQTFGYDPTQGGGVFQIERMGYESAEFIFFGWNKEIRRNTKQLIEVRKGTNSDIRIAVVRKMIAIIREYEHEDFLWESQRLGRNLTMSARLRDNAGLEDFMMREFFVDPRVPQ